MDEHEILHNYERDENHFCRRKASAPERYGALPGVGESRWTPDLREPAHMYDTERTDMARVLRARTQRRAGRENIPSREVLTTEFAIQQRNLLAVRNLIGHETSVLATLATLDKEARTEAGVLTQRRDTAPDTERLFTQLQLDKHITMFNGLLDIVTQRRPKLLDLKRDLALTEELPVEKFMRLHHVCLMQNTLERYLAEQVQRMTMRAETAAAACAGRPTSTILRDSVCGDA
jgi:hypothetical protein